MTPDAPRLAFRRAQPGDVPAAAALMRAAYKMWEPLGFPTSGLTDPYVASFFIADGRVAEDARGEPVAVFSVGHRRPRFVGRDMRVSRAHREDVTRLLDPSLADSLAGKGLSYGYSLAVDPRRARQGIGRQCLAAVEAEAAGLGSHGVVLETGERTTLLVEWYTRSGYRVIGRHTRDSNPLVFLLKTLGRDAPC